MRKRIYIAGPITKGNRNQNLFQSWEAFDELVRCGFAPFNPMTTMQLPSAWSGEFPHHVWLEIDFPWLACADALLRLPGDSVGADQEATFAKENGIPVFYTIKKLTEYFNGKVEASATRGEEAS